MDVIGGMMTQDEGRTTITARDLKVVSALQCNGRMTMQALADKIGISVYAATESYKRLTDAGIMTIVPVCNPLSLGNYSQVLVGLRINGNRNEALAMLKAMPQVTYVSARWAMPTSSPKPWCIQPTVWTIS